jgi:hypothetical protein
MLYFNKKDNSDITSDTEAEMSPKGVSPSSFYIYTEEYVKYLWSINSNTFYDEIIMITFKYVCDNGSIYFKWHCGKIKYIYPFSKGKCYVIFEDGDDFNINLYDYKYCVIDCKERCIPTYDLQWHLLRDSYLLRDSHFIL